ncbi:hypothetical protein X975_26759, partial [Stegodyphus mimosarum]
MKFVFFCHMKQINRTWSGGQTFHLGPCQRAPGCRQ